MGDARARSRRSAADDRDRVQGRCGGLTSGTAGERAPRCPSSPDPARTCRVPAMTSRRHRPAATLPGTATGPAACAVKHAVASCPRSTDPPGPPSREVS
jgi:hypothetical protein